MLGVDLYFVRRLVNHRALRPKLQFHTAVGGSVDSHLHRQPHRFETFGFDPHDINARNQQTGRIGPLLAGAAYDHLPGRTSNRDFGTAHNGAGIIGHGSQDAARRDGGLGERRGQQQRQHGQQRQNETNSHSRPLGQFELQHLLPFFQNFTECFALV